MNFASTIQRKARKAHTCEECWRIIGPGEIYHRTAGSWEGDFFTIKACAHCNVFRKYIDQADDGYNEGYFGGASAWVDNGYYAACDLPGSTFEERLGLYRMARHFEGRWRDRSGELLPVPEEPNHHANNTEAVPAGAASVIQETL